jgi:hypothetical protein
MAAAMASGLDAVRTLDVIVRNTLRGDPRMIAVWARDRRIDYRRRPRKPVARPPTPAATLVTDRVDVADPPRAAALSDNVANAPSDDIRRVEVNAVVAVLDYSVTYLRSVGLVHGSGRNHAAGLPDQGDRIDLESEPWLLEDQRLQTRLRGATAGAAERLSRERT